MHVAKNHMEAVLALDKEAGAINTEYEALLRRYIPLAFGTGPAGLGWLFKALLLPPLSLVMRIPSLPAVYRRFWLAKQAGLSAMSFMLAASCAGLATCPMEGFADRPVRKALHMPRHIVPMIIVPVGYSATPDAIKTRLPTDRLVHRERW
jgi:nitroreductase